jgi:hypothetical protein
MATVIKLNFRRKLCHTALVSGVIFKWKNWRGGGGGISFSDVFFILNLFVLNKNGNAELCESSLGSDKKMQNKKFT